MESKSPLSASQVVRGDRPRTELTADWRPTTGLVDRMLAYREWWNIPEGRARRGAARPGASKHRTRPQQPAR